MKKYNEDLLNELEEYYEAQGGFGNSWDNLFIERASKFRKIKGIDWQAIRAMHHRYIGTQTRSN